MRLKRLLLPFLFVFCIPSHAHEVDRKAYVQSVFDSLPFLIDVLAYGPALDGTPDEEDTKHYIKLSRRLFNMRIKLKLVFVKDPDRFIISPNPKPRLMRSPSEQEWEDLWPQVRDGLIDDPIFINETLLNSPDYKLSLPQLIKLLFHEVGHKLTLDDGVEARDRWAQNIETLLQANYSRTQGSEYTEALSIPHGWVEYALSDNTVKLQPTFWVYRHNQDSIENLTPRIESTVNESSMLVRTLGQEINMALLEVVNIFGTAMREEVGPMVDGFLKSFSAALAGFRGPGDEGNPIEGFTEVFEPFERPMQSMSLLHIKRLDDHNGEVTVVSEQIFTRSHRNKMAGTVKGIPFKDFSSLPVRITIPKTGKASFEITTETSFEKSATSSRVIREGQTLKSVDITFPAPKELMALSLILNYPGGTLRVPAQRIEPAKTGFVRANFDLSARSEYLRTSYADRIILNDDETIYLEQRLEIGGNTTALPALSAEEIPRDTIGVWGRIGAERKFKKVFNHLNAPILFPVISPGSTQFALDPFDLWVQFEMREDLELSQVELLWSRQMGIMEIRPEDPVIPITYNGKKIRYAASGAAIKDEGTLREVVLMDQKTAIYKKSPRPGYKAVQIRATLPLKHARDLEENEAHMLPQATPLGVRIVTKDLRSLSFAFPSDIDPNDFKRNGKFRMDCSEILKGTMNTGETP